MRTDQCVMNAGSVCRFSNLLQGTSSSASKHCSDEADRQFAVRGTSRRTQHHEPVIISVLPCTAETSGVYDPVPGFQEPSQSGEQYTAIYSYTAQVSPFTAVRTLHRRPRSPPTDLCPFRPPPDRGRALFILRGRRGRRGSGQRRLVDGPKEQQHWSSARLLPGQRMTVLCAPRLCQTSPEWEPTAALRHRFWGATQWFIVFFFSS